MVVAEARIARGSRFRVVLMLQIHIIVLLSAPVASFSIASSSCRRRHRRQRNVNSSVVARLRNNALSSSSLSEGTTSTSITSKMQNPNDGDPNNDTLTFEQVERRFRDVWDHFCSTSRISSSSSTSRGNESTGVTTITTTTTTTDTKTIENAMFNNQTERNNYLNKMRMNLLKTRWPNPSLRRCRVQPSTIPDAGLGVFCTRDLKAQELVTLYPGDALLQWDNASHVDDHGTLRVVLGSSSTPTTPPLTSSSSVSASTFAPNTSTAARSGFLLGTTPDAARAYEVRIAPTLSVVGDPQQCADPAYLGHMINDCTALILDCSSKEEGQEGTTSRSINQYNEKSLQCANAQIVIVGGGENNACHVAIVTIKPVVAGSEIFLSYGSNYWLSRQQEKMHTNSTTMSTPTIPQLKRGFQPSPDKQFQKNPRSNARSKNSQQ